MSSISKMVSNFKSGHRSNLYRMEIDGFDETLEFFVKTTQLPGKTLNPIEYKYLNNTIKVAGDPVFEDLSITIANDEDFRYRKLLDQWMEDIKNNAQAIGEGSISNYFRQLRVIPIGRDGEELSDDMYVFHNAWPTSVSPVELGFETSDTISETAVTFSYSHWTRAGQ